MVAVQRASSVVGIITDRGMVLENEKREKSAHQLLAAQARIKVSNGLRRGLGNCGGGGVLYTSRERL